jgi:hypothetical protein
MACDLRELGILLPRYKIDKNWGIIHLDEGLVGGVDTEDQWHIIHDPASVVQTVHQCQEYMPRASDISFRPLLTCISAAFFQ